MSFVQAREIDFLSLKLLMERAPGGSSLKKARAIHRITKAYRNGCLIVPVPGETELQKWCRCEARFMLGDYSDYSGWQFRDPWAKTLWHWRDTKPFGDIAPWNGLKTEKLYIVGEQGLGDEVFFATCLPACIALAGEVIFECQPRLQTIFERSFGIKTVPARIEGAKRLKRALPEGTTAWIPLGDLPRMFRHRLSDFPGTPYLKSDPLQVERFRAYRGRVGVSWRGAQGAIPELMKIPGAVSLQYDRGWDEDVEEPELDLRNDIEGVLGLLANLEKVVCVSTSAAHFAAASGVETHVVIADPLSGVRGNLFPFKWICQATPGRTPWYGQARVYTGFRAYQAKQLTEAA